MTPEQQGVVIAMLKYAAERWTADDLNSAEKLCRAVWGATELAGNADFIDRDEQVDR
jgi:hypothetical protein